MGTDVVVFRRWRDTGGLIALFPENPADIHGWYCDSYETIGQHGAADYHGVIQMTVPARLRQCDELAQELRRIGYSLRPIKRASWRHHERRRQMACRLAAWTPTERR